MKYIYLIVLLTLSYCSSVPEYGQLSDMTRLDELKRKHPNEIDKLNVILARTDAQYPIFDMGFQGFLVVDGDPTLPANPTAEQKARARILNARGKRNLLRTLGYIRFIVNTPEFEKGVYDGSFYSARNATGPWGTVKVGDKLDPARLMEVLRFASYKLTIVKRPINSPAVAVAVVGPSYYVSDLSKMNKDAGSWIAFPNHSLLDQGGYVDGTYHANIYFHEILHNLGFTHNGSIPGSDVPYGLGGVLLAVAGNKEFQTKYAKEIAELRAFYETIYQDWYSNDSYAPTSKTAAMVNFMQLFPEENLIYDTYEDIFGSPQ